MFERFTDRARQAMAHANEEALRLKHEYIGTEHILLGLTRAGTGVAAEVLSEFKIDLGKVRSEVEKIVQDGPEVVRKQRLPQTPRAKKVIERALEEGRSFGHDYVGTEHLLLGLIGVEDGVAGQVLINLGLDLDEIRDRVFQRVGGRNDLSRSIRAVKKLGFQSFASELPEFLKSPKKPDSGLAE